MGTIPELGVAFKKMPDQTEPLLMSMGALWNMMNDASDAQTPIFLLTALHQRFPQFAEKDASKGVWKQQDANEAWLAIVQFLQTLKGKNSVSLINELMRLKFKSTTKITEEGVDEPTTVESSSELSLSCFINQDVKYLITGIKNKMVEEIEKNSPTLSRNAVYERTSRVTRLPKYVAINLIRFFYKTDKQCSAKVLKDVKFPEALDLLEKKCLKRAFTRQLSLCPSRFARQSCQVQRSCQSQSWTRSSRTCASRRHRTTRRQSSRGARSWSPRG